MKIILKLSLFVLIAAALVGCSAPTSTSSSTQNTQGAADLNLASTTLILQAENAAFSGGSVSTSKTGYTGTGYVAMSGTSGSYVEWTFTANSTASASIKFYYTSAVTASYNITVNGGSSYSKSFSSNSSWTSASKSFSLTAGTVKFRITAAATTASGIGIDKIEVTGDVTASGTTSSSTTSSAVSSSSSSSSKSSSSSSVSSSTSSSKSSSSSSVAPSGSFENSPVGYGSGVTGGGNGASIVVTSESALKSALSGSTPVIVVSGSITMSYLSVSVKNKTIIGLKGARLINLGQTADSSGILTLKSGSNNVIIRNITFEGPGAYDCDGRDCLCLDGATNIWIDHCTFQDGCDGNLDQKGNTDNVTISWCRFQYLKTPKPGGSGGADDHRYCGLIGSSSSDKPSDGRFSITWKNCWWDEGCVERMSRARNAELHYLNCYWNSSVAHYYLGLETVPNCYVENSVMVGTSVLDYKSYGDPNNVKFVNCTTNNGADVGSATKPSYSYTPAPLSNTVSDCTSGAGAILTVSSSGQVQ